MLDEDFRIRFAADTLERSQRGSIVANIWWEGGFGTFPDVGWSDFAVVIVGWWANAALSLVEGTATSGRLDFMDGPFHAMASVVDEQRWRIEMIHHGKNTCEHDIEVAPKLLLSEIWMVGSQVLEACRRNQWLGDDISRLIKSMNKITRLFG